MFAEGVGLLTNRLFARMLEQAHLRPNKSSGLARSLFGAMATGGLVGFEPVVCFNGGLSEDDDALDMKKLEVEIALSAAALDWSENDPSILGMLFEAALDPDKRTQFGAHCTDWDKIMSSSRWWSVHCSSSGKLGRPGSGPLSNVPRQLHRDPVLLPPWNWYC